MDVPLSLSLVLMLVFPSTRKLVPGTRVVMKSERQQVQRMMNDKGGGGVSCGISVLRDSGTNAIIT